MLQAGGGRTRTRGTARVAKAWLAALLLVAAAALAACGGSSKDATDGSTHASVPEGRTGGTIVWGKASDVVDFDPVTSGAATSWQIMSRVYEGLVGIDGDLRPVPKLASSWDQTSPTTYVFDIRRGVKFSNGRALTVDDVVGSLKRLIDPRTASYWVLQLGKVKSVSAVGDSQVKVVLAEPNNQFLAGLAGVPAYILPMKELRDGSLDTRRAMLGTGPFKVAAHSQNESWELVRNPYYWQRDEPKVDRLKVRIMPDPAARVAGLRDGSVDVADFDTPDTVKLLRGTANVQTDVVKTTDFYILDVNGKTSLFRDARLREALSLALDRNEINQVALGGTSEPAASSSPSFGICNPADMPYGTPDLERAKQLVEQAGAKGKTVRLLSLNSLPTIGQISQVIQQRLQQIGLDAKIESIEDAELFPRLSRADFDLAMEYFAGFSDPAMTLLWYSEANPFNDGWYVGGGKNDPALEQPIATARSTQDPAERKDAIVAACKQAARDAYIVPLDTRPAFLAYRTDKLAVPTPQVDTTSDPLNGIAGYAVKGG